MTRGVRRPWEAVDHHDLMAFLPPAPAYFESAYLDGPELIAAKQLHRLKERARSAYAVPFFRDRWDAAGVGPSDITTLDDLWRFPAYTVDDLRRSIEAHPPWGDYQGSLPTGVLSEPLRVYMSGGTTGKSRPTFYTQWDREAGAILIARQLYAQGVRFGDVVINSWAYGLHNGAFIFDEALHKWLNCVVIPASTGNVTASRRQVELAIDYRANAILTTGDYLLRLADAAREAGYDPKTDLFLTSIPVPGDRRLLEETFGLPYYATYGVHETQTVACECPAHDGLHIYEDAFIVQIVHPETGEPLPDGELGSICLTEVYKTGSPQFRYTSMDLSYLYPPGRCACGSWLRRMAPFAGRGDNMVKLRGINVWPEALGELAMEIDGVTNDYFVRALRHDGQDELVMMVVSDVEIAAYPTVASRVESLLKDRLGVRIAVEVVSYGSLDGLTEVHTSPKPKRFRDDRDRG